MLRIQTTMHAISAGQRKRTQLAASFYSHSGGGRKKVHLVSKRTETVHTQYIKQIAALWEYIPTESF